MKHIIGPGDFIRLRDMLYISNVCLNTSQAFHFFFFLLPSYLLYDVELPVNYALIKQHTTFSQRNRTKPPESEVKER